MANLNIRTDDQVKQEAEILFEKMGLNMTTAINIFLRQSLREQALPFKVQLYTPNAVTQSALAEGDSIANDATVAGYTDMQSLRRALEI